MPWLFALRFAWLWAGFAAEHLWDRVTAPAEVAEATSEPTSAGTPVSDGPAAPASLVAEPKGKSASNSPSPLAPDWAAVGGHPATPPPVSSVPAWAQKPSNAKQGPWTKFQGAKVSKPDLSAYGTPGPTLVPVEGDPPP